MTRTRRILITLFAAVGLMLGAASPALAADVLKPGQTMCSGTYYSTGWEYPAFKMKVSAPVDWVVQRDTSASFPAPVTVLSGHGTTGARLPATVAGHHRGCATNNSGQNIQVDWLWIFCDRVCAP